MISQIQRRVPDATPLYDAVHKSANSTNFPRNLRIQLENLGTLGLTAGTAASFDLVPARFGRKHRTLTVGVPGTGRKIPELGQ